ncbi:site-specific integrase [Aureimonas psammosilenae]|uniref:tyrosine-type recombinase/integrase n=1 Tax=Aureimonas psammosilenae TaxID=2495496 RepID=UPI0012611198|nr:tyrosine-type recombinase/integrase [Aureimonas psammosilenae]
MEGKRIEERLAGADDDGAPLGSLTFRAAISAAIEWSRQRYATIEGQKEAGWTVAGPTVRSAIENYAARRKKASPVAGGITEGRLRKHALSDEAFAKVSLSKLRASTIEAWRGRLAVRDGSEAPDEDEGPTLAPATLNRLLNDVRAALNSTAETHRRELPAHLPNEIRVGTRAVAVEDEARKQLLTDDEVRRVVAAAFEIDDTGDFGRLVMLAAATGGRYSQLRALKVGSLQPAASRIMIGGSKKGRAAKAKAPVAVPLAPDHIERMAAATAGRAPDEPLLMRWAYRRAEKPARWERHERRAWGPAYEIDRPWAATVKRAGLPVDTIMYALRHSSIVRGLRANLPIRLVAALHDTSVEMVERHYAAFIVDATEDLARRATISFAATVAPEDGS